MGYIKPKKRAARLESRIRNYSENLVRNSKYGGREFTKPGSVNKS